MTPLPLNEKQALGTATRYIAGPLPDLCDHVQLNSVVLHTPACIGKPHKAFQLYEQSLMRKERGCSLADAPGKECLRI